MLHKIINNEIENKSPTKMLKSNAIRVYNIYIEEMEEISGIGYITNVPLHTRFMLRFKSLSFHHESGKNRNRNLLVK